MSHHFETKSTSEDKSTSGKADILEGWGPWWCRWKAEASQKVTSQDVHVRRAGWPRRERHSLPTSVTWVGCLELVWLKDRPTSAPALWHSTLPLALIPQNKKFKHQSFCFLFLKYWLKSGILKRCLNEDSQTLISLMLHAASLDFCHLQHSDL